jgi:chitodextrinase
MSSQKAALEQTEDHMKACWQIVRGLVAMPALVITFVSLLGLLGAAAPTLAQTTSTGPNLDSNGWTVFTPAPITSGTCAAGTANGTCIFYVSDTDGNDCNNGLSPVANQTGCGAGPLKTLSAGYGKLMALNSKPIWLLLKKGDTFTNQSLTNDPSGCCFNAQGASASQPMVISSYDPANPSIPNPSTGGARPLIKTPRGVAGLWAQGAPSWPGGNYLAIVGLEFYNYTADWNSGGTDAGMVGLYFSNPTSWLLVEDCKLSFYSNGIQFNFGPPSVGNNVFARRNVIVDNYANGIISWGITTGFLVEENVIDHNGWPQGNVFLHNLYLSGDNNNPGPVTLRGNIIANDTSGSQIRIGGTITNNLWIGNPYAYMIGMPTAGVMSVIDNDVYTEAVTMNSSYGYGVLHFNVQYEGSSFNLGTLTFSNNIMTQTASPIYGLGIEINAGFTETLSNNIFFKWASPAIADQTSGTVTYTGYNVQDINGANNLGGPEPFPNPSRTVGTYYDSVVGSSGHTSSDFLAAARRQSKANWNPALAAAAVNNYIRAGFGITSGPTTPTTSTTPTPPPPSPGPAADTTAPSVPTGLSVTASSSTQINLSWTAATDNVGVTGYNVFRNATQVGTSATTSYQDTGLSAGTAYSYTVSAYDAAGNASAQSSSVSVTTPAATSGSGSPPNVAINSPQNGSTQNGSVNIAVSANSTTGIASITITGDGMPLTTCSNVTTCSATWQKKKLTKGTHTAGGTAMDNQGRPANATVSFTILK